MFVPGYFPPTSIPTAFLLSSTENIGACDRPCSKVRIPSSAWNFWPWCNTWAPCDRQTLLGGMIIVVDWHTRLSCMVLSCAICVSRTDRPFPFPSFSCLFPSFSIGNYMELSNRFNNLWVPPTSSLWSSHLVLVQTVAGQRWGDGPASAAAGIMLAKKKRLDSMTMTRLIVIHVIHGHLLWLISWIIPWFVPWFIPWFTLYFISNTSR